MNTYDWPNNLISVINALLDPQNARVVTADENTTQAQLIEELVENEEVYELAKSISQNGYFPIEIILVIKVGSKYIVLEGNRRIAALKLLLNPIAAPENQRTKFQRLSNELESKDDLSEVDAIVAPNRDAALKMLEVRHSAPGLKKWTPIAKGKFYYTQIKGGLSFKDAADLNNLNQAEMRKFIQAFSFYNILCHLDLDDDVREFVHDSRKFPITNLQRFFGFSKVRQAFGIEFSDGDIIGTGDQKEFEYGLIEIATMIAKNEIESRVIGNIKGAMKTLNRLKNKPSLKKTETFTITPKMAVEGTFLKQPLISKPRAKPEPDKGRERGSTKIIPNNFLCDVTNTRIMNVFSELKKMSGRQYPNSSSVMMRVLLELALTHYLDKTNHMTTLLKNLGRSAPKKRQPDLKKMMNYISENNGVINSVNYRKALKKFLSNKNSIFSLDTFNAFVHNEKWFPTLEMLRDNWDQLEELFKLILIEPYPNTGQN